MLIRFDDGALRILATDLDPEILRPKRAYRGNRYFARNELPRLCLNALRTSSGESLTTNDLASQVIVAKNFDARDAILRAAIKEQIGDVVKRLHLRGEIEKIGRGRSIGMAALSVRHRSLHKRSRINETFWMFAGLAEYQLEALIS